MTTKPCILIVDDVQENPESKYGFLTDNGFAPIFSFDVNDAQIQIESRRPTLVIVHLKTPSMKGFDLLHSKKNIGDHTPVIVVADADTNNELGVFVLRNGATIYLNQSPQPEFLLAQLYSILALQSRTQEASLLIAGPLRLDQKAHQVFLGEKPIELQPLQYKLLSFLMFNARQRFTRLYLLEAVWGNINVQEGAVTKCVSDLRSKLPEIRSVIRCRGGGYIFDEKVVNV